jgi:hypothetical protein
MQTRQLAAIALTFAVAPALVFFGCNRKEDLAPAPSATQPVAVAPPPVAAPPPAAPAPQPVAVKAAPRGDAGARDGAVSRLTLPDAAGLVLALPDAGIFALPAVPPVPIIHPSALPGIASSIVGGIIGALPPGVIPPAPSK